MTEELNYAQRAQAEHDTRMAAIPAVFKTAHERIAYELALGVDEPADVFLRHGMSSEAGIALLATPGFSEVLSRVDQEVKASGMSFRAKAKVMAEELLGHGFVIATDATAPMTVRADLIKWTAEMAGYKPKATETVSDKNGTGFNLTIQFAGSAPARVIEGDHAVISAETK